MNKSALLLLTIIVAVATAGLVNGRKYRREDRSSSEEEHGPPDAGGFSMLPGFGGRPHPPPPPIVMQMKFLEMVQQTVCAGLPGPNFPPPPHGPPGPPPPGPPPPPMQQQDATNHQLSVGANETEANVVGNVGESDKHNNDDEAAALYRNASLAGRAAFLDVNGNVTDLCQNFTQAVQKWLDFRASHGMNKNSHGGVGGGNNGEEEAQKKFRQAMFRALAYRSGELEHLNSRIAHLENTRVGQHLKQSKGGKHL